MKIFEKFPYYLVEVRFQENMIQCYDLAAKKMLLSVPYNKEIATFRKEGSLLYLILNKHDEIVSEISILIRLIAKKSEIQTEAEYILDLHMLSQSHGYYFGYYEIGEFKLTEDSKLEKIRSYPLEYCTAGRATKSKHVFLGCREEDKHLLVKINWKSESNPNILWKKTTPSAIMVMELLGDLLFLGLKNGILQIWNVQEDKCIKEIKLFSSTISVLSITGNYLTLASRTGDLARISKNGDIHWKTNFTQDKIVGIYEDKDYILVINTLGEQFHVDIKSGNPKKHGYTNLKLGGNVGLSSNIIKFRNRFVITGYGGIWFFRWGNDNNATHKYMDDPLMRVIRQHPFGFYSGDDEGCVCFWDIGDPEIKVENFTPPLKNYEEYTELKAAKLAKLLKPSNNREKKEKSRKKKKKRSHS